MLVTDKEYYLNDNLKEICDLTIRRTKKNWDNLIIIDGPERSGKSTLARAIAYYISYTKGAKFTIENIFFDPDEMLEYATTHQDEMIIWDEAAFGGQSNQWQNEVQRKMNTMLMVCGKFKNTYIFIIPSFFRLNRYLAIDRSLGLIHVYSPDLITRGQFICLSEAQKIRAYNKYRQTEWYGKQHSFRGTFTIKNQDFIDEAVYEAKKDAAIKKFLEDKGQKKKDKLELIQNKLATNMTPQEVMSLVGVSQKTVYNWKNRAEKGGGSPL